MSDRIHYQINWTSRDINHSDFLTGRKKNHYLIRLFQLKLSKVSQLFAGRNDNDKRRKRRRLKLARWRCCIEIAACAFEEQEGKKREEREARPRFKVARSLVWTKFGARCCRGKKKRDDRWWESTGLVTVASYRRRHHLAEEVPGLYIRRLTLEDPRRREPSGSRSQSPARHICHPRSGYAPSVRGSSRYTEAHASPGPNANSTRRAAPVSRRQIYGRTRRLRERRASIRGRWLTSRRFLYL